MCYSSRGPVKSKRNDLWIVISCHHSSLNEIDSFKIATTNSPLSSQFVLSLVLFCHAVCWHSITKYYWRCCRLLSVTHSEQHHCFITLQGSSSMQCSRVYSSFFWHELRTFRKTQSLRAPTDEMAYFQCVCCLNKPFSFSGIYWKVRCIILFTILFFPQLSAVFTSRPNGSCEISQQ